MPVSFYDEKQYKYSRQLGRFFLTPGKPKQVGPITCPVCKGRTVKKYLEEFQMCARCKKVKDASEKEAATGGKRRVAHPVVSDSGNRYAGRGRDLLRSTRS